MSLLTLVGGGGSETGEGTRDPKGRRPPGIAGSACRGPPKDAGASGAGQAGCRPPLALGGQGTDLHWSWAGRAPTSAGAPVGDRPGHSHPCSQ